MQAQKTATIFISHVGQDTAWVSEFAAELNRAGLQTWYDQLLVPGRSWATELENALRESDTFVLIVSRASLKDELTFFKFGAAVADKKLIIPIMIEEIERSQLPGIFRNYQYLRASTPGEAGIKVAQMIESSAGSYA